MRKLRLSAALAVCLSLVFAPMAVSAAEAPATQVAFVTSDGSALAPGTLIISTLSDMGALAIYLQENSSSPTKRPGNDLPKTGTLKLVVENGPGYEMTSKIPAAERELSAKIIYGLATFVLPRAHNISVTVQKSTPTLKSPVLEIVAADSEELVVVNTIPNATPKVHKVTVGTGKYFARLKDGKDPLMLGFSGPTGYESSLQTISVPGSSALSVKAKPVSHGTLSLKLLQDDGSKANYRRSVKVCSVVTTFCRSVELASNKYKATVKLPPGYYTVSGLVREYPASFATSTLQNESLAMVEVKKNKTTKSTLRVRTWGASASGNHTVSIKHGMPGMSLASLETAKSSYPGASYNGSAVFYGVKNGTYRLTIPGLATRPRVTVKNGKLVSAKSIKTSGTKITGKISGTKKAKYPVEIVLTNSKTKKRVSAVTVAEGSTYTFYNVPKGKYSLTAYNGVSHVQTKSIDAGSLRTASGKVTVKSSTKKATVNLKFKSAGKVKVKLVGPTGKPLKNTPVALRTSTAWLPSSYSAVTNSKGYVTFTNVPYGKVQVISARGEVAALSRKTIKVKKSSQSVILKVTQ